MKAILFVVCCALLLSASDAFKRGEKGKYAKKAGEEVKAPSDIMVEVLVRHYLFNVFLHFRKDQIDAIESHNMEILSLSITRYRSQRKL
jgi:hypothetical protein